MQGPVDIYARAFMVAARLEPIADTPATGIRRRWLARLTDGRRRLA